MAGDLIIGVGTGRCGTVSLSQFLDAQAGIFMLHEGALDDRRELFDWTGDEDNIIRWLSELKQMAGDKQLVGDTGMYFLPYVDLIFEKFPETRFICFERNRSEVIRSFERKTSDNRHFWYNHNGKKYRKDPVWDSKFPKFDVEDKQTAIGLYWDMYHETSVELARNYPDRFHIFPMAILNAARGRAAVLDYIKYDGPRILDGDFRRNSRRNNRNFRYWLKQKLGLAH